MPLHPPEQPERGPCEPAIIEEPVELPEETPLPLTLPVEEPVAAPR